MVGVIGELNTLLYITCMNFLKPIICMLLTFSLVGCAVSKNPSPVIRYGANTGATMALPGLTGAAVTAVIACAAWEEDEKNEGYVDANERQRRNERDGNFLAAFGISLGVAGVGYVAGALIGGTVGFFKWIFNGFKDDDIASVPDLPEKILPPTKPDNEYGSKL